MNTSMKQEPGHPAGEQWGFAWSRYIAVALMAVAASGCCWIAPQRCQVVPPPEDGQPTPPGNPAPGTDPLPVNDCNASDCTINQSRSALRGEDCPTGQCDPDGGPNGLGIYIQEGSNYCLPDYFDRTRFCPEAFVNTPTGVVLRVRDRLLESGRKLYNAELTATRQASTYAKPEDITGLRIRADNSAFIVSGSIAGSPYTAQGLELDTVTLKVSFWADPISGDVPDRYDHLMTVKLTREARGALSDATPETAHHLWRYDVAYRRATGTTWMRHCNDAAGATQGPSVSFLPAREVHGMNAAVRHDPNVTTMACASGAIATCLQWGYQPWDLAGRTDEQREFVYGACLQAKRAAYFVGRGQFRSYTANGTHILRRDQYGFGRNPQGTVDDIPYLEALWSPHGAECLNVENRRRRDIDIRDTYGVPRCEPVQWTQERKLATGPMERPAD